MVGVDSYLEQDSGCGLIGSSHVRKDEHPRFENGHVLPDRTLTFSVCYEARFFTVTIEVPY